MKQNGIYQNAVNFIVDLIKTKTDDDPMMILNEYLQRGKAFTTIEDVYKRQLLSLNNRNMMSKVVNWTSKEKEVGALLGGFSPSYVITTFKDYNELYDALFTLFSFDSSRPKNLWQTFAHGAYDAATFLSDFKTGEEFDEYVHTFLDGGDAEKKATLPMLLQHKIHGMGFTLCCDFLKELGYEDYPKPDVHIKELLVKLGISSKTDDYDIYLDMVKLANDENVTPYALDKVLWLIGSGTLYFHGINLGNNKEKFVSMMSKQN